MSSADGVSGKVVVVHGNIALNSKSSINRTVTTYNKSLVDVLVTLDGNISTNIKVSIYAYVLLERSIATNNKCVANDYISGYSLIFNGKLIQALVSRSTGGRVDEILDVAVKTI